jgi:hypothetical protein
MKIRLAPFNIYLLVLTTLLAISCKTPEERKRGKEASTFRVYLASSGGPTGGTVIYRQSPIHLSVEREPFLTEIDLDSASLVDVPGGFAINAQFNGHGALVLEGVTVAHKGQYLAIHSSFGESRWLAAPLITRRISNGDLVFTPDATHEEADRIVSGLTNVIKKVKKASSF